jgi:hypothetical protein
VNTTQDTALAIYVILARDWSEALGMLQEADLPTAELLLALLTRPSKNYSELNSLFVPLVKSRITALGPSEQATPPAPSGAKK